MTFAESGSLSKEIRLLKSETKEAKEAYHMIEDELFKLSLQAIERAVIALLFVLAMQFFPRMHPLFMRCRINIEVVRR